MSIFKPAGSEVFKFRTTIDFDRLDKGCEYCFSHGSLLESLAKTVWD
jgi:hypothetical protein